MRDIALALRFYLVFQLTGLCAIPMAFVLLRRLPDRGWAAAKILGPLVLVYISWLGAHGLWNYRTSAFALTGLPLILLSLFFLQRNFTALRTFIICRWRLIVALEIIFALAFVAGCAIRAIAPEATFEIERTAAEKFFDFTLFHNFCRVQTFPAEDTWLAGNPLNYYYFGHLFFASMTRLAGIAPEYGFNLTIAAVMGLVATLAFSLAYTFTRSIGWSSVAAWIVTLSGNMEPLIQIVRGLHSNQNLIAGFSFWDSSRVIPPEMITEFPAFSFLLGDPHAHVLGLPITMTTLLIVVVLSRGLRVYRAKPAETVFELLPLWLTFSFLLGASSAANSWDYYTSSFIAAVILGGLFLKYIRRHPQSCVAGLAICLLMILIARHILFLPFERFFQAPFQLGWTTNQWLPPRFQIDLPLKIVPTDLRSPFGPWLLHWGLLLLAPFLYFGGGACKRLFECRWEKFFFFSALIAFIFIAGYNLGHTWTVVFILLLVLATLFHSRFDRSNPQENIIRLLLSAACIILAGVEILYLDDAFTNDNERMNTLFKSTYPLWPALSLISIWCWSRLLIGFRKSLRGALLAGLFSLTLTIGILYPVLGVAARLHERESFPNRAGTLDGLRHLRSGNTFSNDFALAQWMKENLPLGTRVVEACGKTYAPDGRIAAWSGLPSVLGWKQHESVWRGPAAFEYIETVNVSVDKFYRTAQPAFIQPLGAKYVVFGTLEYHRYGWENAMKFRESFPVMQKFGLSTLYKIPSETPENTGKKAY